MTHNLQLAAYSV